MLLQLWLDNVRHFCCRFFVWNLLGRAAILKLTGLLAFTSQAPGLKESNTCLAFSHSFIKNKYHNIYNSIFKSNYLVDFTEIPLIFPSSAYVPEYIRRTRKQFRRIHLLYTSV